MSNTIRGKSFLNRSIRYRIALLSVVSITLLSSSYLLPLAYSQEFSFILKWSNFGTGSEELSWPEGIAVDSSSGNVYVADTANNRIQVFSSNGTFITEWGRYGTGNGSFNHPAAIALDQENNIFVVDNSNNRIQVFSRSIVEESATVGNSTGFGGGFLG